MLFKSINSARFSYTQQCHAYCGSLVEEPDGNFKSIKSIKISKEIYIEIYQWADCSRALKL